MTELVRTYKLTDSGAWGWVTEEAEGGGGSLPSWWTVDSTPGSESVEFAGAVTIQAAIGKNPLDVIFPTGSAKRIYFETEEGAAWRWSADGGAIALRYANVDGDPLLDVTAAGAVTISPSDLAGQQEALKIVDPGAPGDYDRLLWITAANGTDSVFVLDGAGELELHVRDPGATGFFISDNAGTTGDLFRVIPFGVGPAVTVGPSGAVTISPSDPDVVLETVAAPPAFADGSGVFVEYTTPEDGVVHSFDAYGDLNMMGTTGNGAAAVFLGNRDNPLSRSRFGAGAPDGTAFYYADADDGIGGFKRVAQLLGWGSWIIDPLAGHAPLTILGLDTSDPGVLGVLWNDTGTLKVSAG